MSRSATGHETRTGAMSSTLGFVTRPSRTTLSAARCLRSWASRGRLSRTRSSRLLFLGTLTAIRTSSGTLRAAENVRYQNTDSLSRGAQSLRQRKRAKRNFRMCRRCISTVQEWQRYVANRKTEQRYRKFHQTTIAHAHPGQPGTCSITLESSTFQWRRRARPGSVWRGHCVET